MFVDECAPQNVVHDNKAPPKTLKRIDRLDVLAHHGNHQIEQTHGFDESEAQNGVGEELATQSRVAGHAHEEGGEDETDTDTSTAETDGGRTHTQVLGDFDHGVGDFRGVRTTGLVGVEDLAHVGLEDVGALLTLQGLESVGRWGGLGECPLGDSVDLDTHGRASNFGGCGHLGGQSGGEHAGGHCDCFDGGER
jgi:hypothetical protein